MNNPSPLVPQGSLLEQKNKGRARVKIAVFFVLAVHGIGLLALLMQGCRKEDPAAPADSPTNAVAPPVFEPSTQLADTATAVPAPPPIPDTPPATTEYIVAKGDTLSGIATTHKVSLKELMEANPGIEPTKLQLGQKLIIPPPKAATAAPTAGVAPDAGSDEIYVVKSGDTLSKIATDHQTTVRALRAANNLRTDSIKVGQKLKIPKGSTPAPAPQGA